MDAEFRPSPLAMAVLSMLHADPLHPYAMQRLIKEWGKDRVVNVGQRANLYKTIRRLQDAGLVAVRQTERDHRYPERTVYELTDAGHEAAIGWIADMIAVPRNEFPQFPAALSFVMLLGPDKTREVLEERAVALTAALKEIDADLAQVPPGLPRVTLMDDEYRRAVTAAELAWVTSVIEDLKAGALTWSYEMLAEVAQYLPEDAVSSTPPPWPQQWEQ
jgi:DNA-binding PadR family transcriptional regulator